MRPKIKFLQSRTMDFVRLKPGERHHRFYICPNVCKFVQFSGTFISKFLINARGGAVGWGTALQAGRSRVRFPLVSLEFFNEIILLAALWLGVDSSSNRNEYQEYLLGGKGGRCVGLTTLPPSCAECLEIWEPQPPGTLRACPGLYMDCFCFFS